MRLIEYTVLLMTWGGLLLAALSLHDMQAFDQHSICGSWGCGPPTNALLAIHLGWIVALWPPLFYLPWRLQFTRRTVKTMALTLIAVGLTGLLTITVWQWAVWLPNASQWARSYILQRCGFAILTAVDWPFMQLFAGGSLLTIGQRWKRPIANAVGISGEETGRETRPVSNTSTVPAPCDLQT